MQKYADASRVVVEVREGGGTVSFQVSDDGRGFDAATVTRGAGLTNMADRLDALGGALAVTSAPGCGSTVRGRLPCIPADVVGSPVE